MSRRTLSLVGIDPTLRGPRGSGLNDLPGNQKAKPKGIMLSTADSRRRTRNRCHFFKPVRFPADAAVSGVAKMVISKFADRQMVRYYRQGIASRRDCAPVSLLPGIGVDL
jgi:hypothetical protein